MRDHEQCDNPRCNFSCKKKKKERKKNNIVLLAQLTKAFTRSPDTTFHYLTTIAVVDRDFLVLNTHRCVCILCENIYELSLNRQMETQSHYICTGVMREMKFVFIKAL